MLMALHNAQLVVVAHFTLPLLVVLLVVELRDEKCICCNFVRNVPRGGEIRGLC